MRTAAAAAIVVQLLTAAAQQTNNLAVPPGFDQLNNMGDWKLIVDDGAHGYEEDDDNEWDDEDKPKPIMQVADEGDWAAQGFTVESSPLEAACGFKGGAEEIVLARNVRPWTTSTLLQAANYFLTGDFAERFPPAAVQRGFVLTREIATQRSDGYAGISFAHLTTDKTVGMALTVTKASSTVAGGGSQLETNVQLDGSLPVLDSLKMYNRLKEFYSPWAVARSKRNQAPLHRAALRPRLDLVCAQVVTRYTPSGNARAKSTELRETFLAQIYLADVVPFELAKEAAARKKKARGHGGYGGYGGYRRGGYGRGRGLFGFLQMASEDVAISNEEVIGDVALNELDDVSREVVGPLVSFLQAPQVAARGPALNADNEWVAMPPLPPVALGFATSWVSANADSATKQLAIQKFGLRSHGQTFRCREAELINKPGVAESCFVIKYERQPTVAGPQQKSLQTAERMYAQCLGMHPVGSKAVLRRMNVVTKKGASKDRKRKSVEEVVLTYTCTTNGWTQNRSYPPDAGNAIIETCRRSHESSVEL